MRQLTGRGGDAAAADPAKGRETVGSALQPVDAEQEEEGILAESTAPIGTIRDFVSGRA